VTGNDPLCVHIEGLNDVRLGPSQRSLLLGSSVDLLLRPERVRPACGAPPGWVATKMKVDTLINYGESVVALGSALGGPFRIRFSGEMPAHLSEGDEIQVAWQTSDMHAIPTIIHAS
jgi:hypothetical protein